MVYYDKRLVKLFDRKIFIDISKDTFLNRKVEDLLWGREPDWYIEHIWGSYLKYGTIPKDDPSYLVIKGDGIVDLEKVYEFVG